MNINSHMKNMIHQFRDHCLSMFAYDIPLVNENRPNRILNTNDILFFMPDSTDTMANICTLTNSPRMLKLVLRHTYRTWEHLHGNIDFDDLLIVNTLQYTTPTAFDFIYQHIDLIRTLSRSRNEKNDEHSRRLEQIENLWKITTESASWDIVSTKKLILFLFPSWQNDSYESSPQGIQNSVPIDYWKRLLDGEIPDDEITDQDILRGFHRWRTDPDKDFCRSLSLIDLLSDNQDFCAKFEYFGSHILSEDQFHDISSQLFNKGLKLKGVEADQESLPGFLSLWRISLSVTTTEKHQDWVIDECTKALKISLPFALSTLYFWQTTDKSAIRNGTDKYKPSVCMSFINNAKEYLKDNPTKLLKCLDPKNVYSAIRFLLLYQYAFKKKDLVSVDKSEMQWFADLLLDGAKISPQCFIPQISIIIIEEEYNFDGFSYSVNNKLIVHLFGENLKTLQDILLNEISLDEFDNRVVEHIRLAQQYVKDI